MIVVLFKEQTNEREQERDEYQQEIQGLKDQIQEKSKKDGAEYRLEREVCSFVKCVKVTLVYINYCFFFVRFISGSKVC